MSDTPQDQRRRELWRALRERVLTNEELLEVAMFGSDLNVPYGVPYMASEKLAELNNALLIQQMLQMRREKP